MIASRGLGLPALALWASLCAACGTPLLKLPTGPGTPADVRAAVAEATAACRAVSSFTAEVAVRGTVARRRMRGRLLVGLASPASAYLEWPAPFGAPVFVLAARNGEATLWLPRDRRVLERARPDAVLEALTGVPLAPDELRLTLTGCTEALDVQEGSALDGGWLVVPGPERLYLRRVTPAEPWRLVASLHTPPGTVEWRAEYSDFAGGLPRSVHLVSADNTRFNLRLALSEVELNTPLGPDTFSVRIPAGTDPITIEEIRDAGPLGGGGRSKSNE